MKKKKDVSLTQICQQLEEMLPILQDSIALLRQEINRKRRGPLTPKPIRVTMPDKIIICEDVASHTLLAVIERLNVERIYQLSIGTQKRPLISKSPKTSNYRESASGGYYILTGSNTDEKIKHLREIAQRLDIQMTVEDLRKKS